MNGLHRSPKFKVEEKKIRGAQKLKEKTHGWSTQKKSGVAQKKKEKNSWVQHKK